MKILEELFYGNITPHERRFKRGGEFEHILQLMNKNDNELTATLTEKQKEVFDKFKTCHVELSDIAEREIFINGFNLGARMVFEIMSVTENQFEDSKFTLL
mgnify:CR=1 FL=1